MSHLAARREITRLIEALRLPSGAGHARAGGRDRPAPDHAKAKCPARAATPRAALPHDRNGHAGVDGILVFRAHVDVDLGGPFPFGT
jgi:hypothetical protein